MLQTRIAALAQQNQDKNSVLNHALIFSFLSDLAYRSLDIIKWRLGVEEEDVQQGRFIYFDDGRRTQGFIIQETEEDIKHVIIVFRGTEYNRPRDLIDDWLGNFKTKLVPFTPVESNDAKKDSFGKVHEGFLEGIVSVWDDSLLKNFKKTEDQSKIKLWFTGHSLGAALATLAAAKWVQAMPKHIDSVQGVYTFGSPRCGDEVFAKFYSDRLEEKTFRFVNHRDLVPDVPSTMTYYHWKDDYKHVGCLWYIDEDKVINPNYSQSEGPLGWIGRWVPSIWNSKSHRLELDLRTLDHDHRRYFDYIKQGINSDSNNSFHKAIFEFKGHHDSDANKLCAVM